MLGADRLQLRSMFSIKLRFETSELRLGFLLNFRALFGHGLFDQGFNLLLRHRRLLIVSGRRLVDGVSDVE